MRGALPACSGASGWPGLVVGLNALPRTPARTHARPLPLTPTVVALKQGHVLVLFVQTDLPVAGEGRAPR